MSKSYYNEIDPKAAAWLRELISDGLIPPGDVDERSICDVAPKDLAGYTQCHFFAGIGGWAYALRLADWPDERPVWTGSCPCQPFSVAGKGRGADDERHLWPAFRWLIAKCRPATVFGEQVASADGRLWLAGVRADLEAMVYAVGAADLCAAGVGAPHIRQRLWWVADGNGVQRGSGHVAADPKTDGRDNPRRCSPVDWSRAVWWPCRDGKWRRVPTRGGGDAEGSKWEISVQQRGQGQARADSGRTGGDGGVADAETTIRGSLRENNAGGRTAEVGRPGGVAGWMGDPASVGQHRGAEDGKRQSPEMLGERHKGSDAFKPSRHDRLEAEPALFPLADGVPGRVGLLRGAGNAIVPEVAAEFIRAFRETEGGQ